MIAESWTVEILDTRTWESTAILEYEEVENSSFGYYHQGIRAVAASPRYVATAGADSLIVLWDYDTPDIPTSVKPVSWGAVKREVAQ